MALSLCTADILDQIVLCESGLCAVGCLKALMPLAPESTAAAAPQAMTTFIQHRNFRTSDYFLLHSRLLGTPVLCCFRI